MQTILMKLRFTLQAHAVFSKLPPETKSLVKKALTDILSHPYSGKPLQGELSGYSSYRTKRYRVIYRFNDENRSVDVIHIGHRSGIYEQLETLLRNR